MILEVMNANSAIFTGFSIYAIAKIAFITARIIASLDLSLLLQNATHIVLNHHSMNSYSGIGSIECTLDFNKSASLLVHLVQIH